MTADTIALRNCTELEEFRACVGLQKEVWGFADNELVPLRIFSLAPKIGGQVIGAWEGETLVGFAFSIPGIRNGHPYLHSHMLAVKEAYRNSGLGRRIKLFQRTDAIAHGYRAAGVDLRSAGDQERVPQSGAPGGDRSPLQPQSVRDYVVAAAGFSSDRPSGCGMVVDFEARRNLAVYGQTSRVGERAQAWTFPSRFTRGSNSRTRGRKRRRCNRAIARHSCRRSRAGWRAWAMSAMPAAMVDSCWDDGMRSGRMRASEQ